eukprot:SAG31_NODE_4026_length_3653_cov_19.795442_6_plen_122_part_00
MQLSRLAAIVVAIGCWARPISKAANPTLDMNCEHGSSCQCSMRLHIVPDGTPAELAAAQDDRHNAGCQADPTAPFSTPDQALEALQRLIENGIVASGQMVCVVLPGIAKPEHGPLCQPDYW